MDFEHPGMLCSALGNRNGRKADGVSGRTTDGIGRAIEGIAFMNCRQSLTLRLTSPLLRRARRADSACDRLALTLAGLLLMVLLATGAAAQLLPEASFDGASGRVAGPTLSTFLRTDGSVDLEAVRGSGYEGPIDLGGLGLVTDPESSHLQSVGLLPPAATQAVGDEHWAAGFEPIGASSGIVALAVWQGRLYVAGSLTHAGGVPVNRIACWDGNSWSALGTGIEQGNWVNSLIVYEDNLIAGGWFWQAGGVAVNGIARWNGVTWLGIGTGEGGGEIKALAANGSDLFAGGRFSELDGVAVNNVAHWNGVSWLPLGEGVSGDVTCLVMYGSDLVAGGTFSSAGGSAANGIARWDGVDWSPMGAGLVDVYSLVVYGDDLVAGGGFIGGFVARWGGSSWLSIGDGLSAVRSLAVLDGDLIAGGYFPGRIARWNGLSWTPLGAGTSDYVGSLAVNGNQLYAGGPFAQAGGISVNGIATWSENAWHPIGSSQGAAGSVQVLVPTEGGIAAAGDFTGTGSAANTQRAALFDGAQWSSLSTGFDQSVRCLVSHNFDLVAGGYFMEAGGITAKRIARWDGFNWSPIGSGMNERVLALASLDSTLYAGGGFTQADDSNAAGIAKWNGSNWSPLGAGVQGGVVYSMTIHGGSLIVGGTFSSAGGLTCQRIGRWDGAAWSTLPGMSGPVLALGHYGGQLVAGGNFVTAGDVTAGNIAIYDGTNWHALGTGTSGPVLAMAEVGGRLYVGGDFTTAGGVTVNRLAVWDGLTWSALGSGMNAAVRALAFADPYLYVGGDFTTAGDKPSSYIARWDGLLGTCSVALTQPTAAAALCGGLPFDIRWTFTGDCGPVVNLDLFQDGVLCGQIAAGTANDGVYTWFAEACAGQTEGYTIRITESESGAFAVSDSFQILPAGALAVTTPNGGEHLVTGLSTELTWTLTACCGPLVRLELVAEGSTCTVLADSLPNSGSFFWTPERCGPLATGYRLRIVDLSSGASDDSDGDFVIGPAYRVLAVADVGNDQGGQVRLQWFHQDNDQAGADTTITQYSLWRRVDANLKGGAASTVPPEYGALTYPPGTWDYVATVPAGGEESYSTVCQSLCDSTAVDGICWSVFFVRAHTAQPVVYFDTLPDSGYSVDNIAPTVPTGLLREEPDLLTWQDPIDADFSYFTVYGSAVDHLDGSELLVDHTTGTSLDIAGLMYAHFLVTATDCNGNESEAAVLDALTDVPDAQPTSYALYPCAPNPFNPITTIRFDLPQTSQVSLRVYDLAGRLVQTLVDGEVMAAGRGEAVWRGCDQSGRQMAAGTYFCRLDAGSFHQTRRMTLVK